MNPSLRQTLVFSSSLIVSGIVFNYLFGPLSFIFVGTTLVHELGHFFAAKYANASNVCLPLFVPVPPLLLGITYVEGDYNKALVAYSGPICGSIAALSFAVASALLGLQSAMYLSLSLLFVQFCSLFISSDAKKARNWLRKQNRI